MSQHSLRRYPISISCAVAFSASLFYGAAAPAQAQDAQQIVRAMVSKYQSADSLSCKTEAKMAVIGQQETYKQNTQFTYKRPNLLSYHSTDPRIGTLNINSDGKVITVYRAAQNIFTRRTAPKTLGASIVAFEKAAEDSLNVGLAQVINPLSVQVKPGALREAAAFKYLGRTTFNGHPVHKISGQVNPAWVKQIAGSEVQVQAQASQIELWIDAETNLLRKVICRILWQTPGTMNRKRVLRPGGFAFEEVYRENALNVNAKESDFRFDPPKNAVQIFQERK